jgi:hypothetical protein
MSATAFAIAGFGSFGLLAYAVTQIDELRDRFPFVGESDGVGADTGDVYDPILMSNVVDGWGWCCLDCSSHSWSNREYRKQNAEEYAQRHEREYGHGTVLAPANEIRDAVNGKSISYESGTDDGLHECVCGAEFATARQLTGHYSHCDEYLSEDEDVEADPEDVEPSIQTTEPDAEAVQPEANSEFKVEIDTDPNARNASEDEPADDSDEPHPEYPKAMPGDVPRLVEPHRFADDLDCPVAGCGFHHDWKPSIALHASSTHDMTMDEWLDVFLATNRNEDGGQLAMSDGTGKGYKYLVMDELTSRDEPGRFEVGDLAEHVGLPNATVSSILSRLHGELDGLVDGGYGEWVWRPERERWEEPRACDEPGCGFSTDVPSAMQRHIETKHGRDVDVAGRDDTTPEAA